MITAIIIAECVNHLENRNTAVLKCIWNVEGTMSGIDETKWVELCSDCLMDATEQNIEVRCNDGKSFPDGFVLFRGES